MLEIKPVRLSFKLQISKTAFYNPSNHFKNEPKQMHAKRSMFLFLIRKFINKPSMHSLQTNREQIALLSISLSPHLTPTFSSIKPYWVHYNLKNYYGDL